MTATELRERRRQLGYTVSVLAEVLGVDTAVLRAWECGDEPIPDPIDLDVAFRALTRTRKNVWPHLMRGEDFPAC